MKFIKKNTFILSIISTIVLSILFSSCHKRIELEDNYADFRRVVGPDGGTINFFEYNPENDKPEIIVSIDFPENALDSLTVFNMYEFINEGVYIDILRLGRRQNSKFLYFVPFYESYGYNEVNSNSDTYHLSIDFNTAVEVTYKLISDYAPEFDAKLFRIKIPATNEWGTEDNVWINWNYQGYPDGYDIIDLTYLINGRWTSVNDWGSTDFNLDNWEEVTNYTYNTFENTVSFQIYNTDYMYVMAKEITN